MAFTVDGPNSKILDTNGNELLRGSATASAVNDVTLTNAATGNAPALSATGDDTNINLGLTAKGTGLVTVGDRNTATAIAGAATVNAQRGVVTSEALTTAAGSDYTLTLTNSKITASSIVMVSLTNGTNTIAPIYAHSITPGSGSATIKVRNAHASSALNGTILISFIVL